MFFISLIVSLIDHLVNAGDLRIESLSRILPSEHENAGELEGLRLVIDAVDVLELELRTDDDRAVVAGRAEQRFRYGRGRKHGACHEQPRKKGGDPAVAGSGREWDHRLFR